MSAAAMAVMTVVEVVSGVGDVGGGKSGWRSKVLHPQAGEVVGDQQKVPQLGISLDPMA